MSKKEMMERYIFEVTKRVPKDMREEITLELQSLIDDMCGDGEATVEEVLQKLGSPQEFARKYRDIPKYLIGPEYYDNYMWVLKLALGAIMLAALVSSVVQGITHVDEGVGIVGLVIGEFFEIALNGTYSAIGVVTIIFGVLEWKNVKVDLKPESKWSVDELQKNAANAKVWTPNLLPPIPDKRAVISRGESVFSILIITVFGALVVFTPEVFSAFHHDGYKFIHISNLFNLEAWDRIIPILIIAVFVGLLDEVIRLVAGYYCKTVMISSVFCGVVHIACGVILMKVLPFWNPSFGEDLKQYIGVAEYAAGDFLGYWGTSVFNNGFLVIICVISGIEMAVSIYKTLRYAK